MEISNRLISGSYKAYKKKYWWTSSTQLGILGTTIAMEMTSAKFNGAHQSMSWNYNIKRTSSDLAAGNRKSDVENEKENAIWIGTVL